MPEGVLDVAAVESRLFLPLNVLSFLAVNAERYNVRPPKQEFFR